MLTEGVGCTLSSDKNNYSLQRLVAKVELVVYSHWLIWLLVGEPLLMTSRHKDNKNQTNLCKVCGEKSITVCPFSCVRTSLLTI